MQTLYLASALADLIVVYLWLACLLLDPSPAERTPTTGTIGRLFAVTNSRCEECWSTNWS